jgi:hypothetical protein
MGATMRDLSGNVEEVNFPFIAEMPTAHDCRVSASSHSLVSGLRRNPAHPAGNTCTGSAGRGYG